MNVGRYIIGEDRHVGSSRITKHHNSHVELAKIQVMKIDFEKLQLVHDKAKQAVVSYALHYCESDDSWFFSVSSIAPSENWCGGNHSFDIAVECVLERLKSLSSSAQPARYQRK